MPKYSIVEEACRHCWSNNFMDSFKDFFNDHCDVFIDAPNTPSEEQNLEYYELFQRYLRLYETTLSDYINSLDCSIEEFYEQLGDILNDKEIKDKKLLHFVNYLIACTDYPSFYKVMVRAAKKAKKAEAKSESKLDESVSSDSKFSNDSKYDRSEKESK